MVHEQATSTMVSFVRFSGLKLGEVGDRACPFQIIYGGEVLDI